MVSITATSPAGCFNAIQTFLQTLPIKAVTTEKLEVATGKIIDYPEFAFFLQSNCVGGFRPETCVDG